MNEAELEVLMWAEAETKAAVHPNPACQPWCTTSHDRTEYAVTSGLMCSRVLGRGLEWEVRVEAGAWAVDEDNLAGPTRPLEVDVLITGLPGRALESLHPGLELTQFIAALQEASTFCRAIAR